MLIPDKPECLDDKWSWDSMRKCWDTTIKYPPDYELDEFEEEYGHRRIYPVVDGDRTASVISEYDTWIEGSYASVDAALAAFDLSVETLRRICESVTNDVTLDDINNHRTETNNA